MMFRRIFRDLTEAEWEEPLSVPPIEVLPSPTAPGKIIVRTPYNKYFVEEVKLIPTRRWTGEYWEFDEAYRQEVEALVRKYFPLRPQEYRLYTAIKPEFGNISEGDTSIEIDGIGIVSFTRDWAKAYNKIYPRVEIYYQNLESGGVRRSPLWKGKLVFLIAYRKDPIIEIPKGTQLILHYVGETPPPSDLVRRVVDEAKRDP
jgi:hypothetical protein